MVVPTQLQLPVSATGDLARKLRRELDMALARAKVSNATAAVPPAVADDIHSHLMPLSGLLAHKATAKPGPLAPLVRAARGLCKVFLRPWLDFQTRYNHGVIESLAGQVAVRRQSEAAAAARLDKCDTTAAELREQVLQVRAELADLLAAHRLTNSRLGEVSAALRQAKAELAAVRKSNRERAGGESAAASGDAGLPFTPPPASARPPTVAVTERVLEHLFAHSRVPRPPARVLDLGCAESGASAELAGLGYRVVGVDVRRLPLEHPNFTQVQATLGDLPFPDGSFDVAVRLTAGEHAGLGWSTRGDATADGAALREAVRTLKPGGTFVLTVPFGRATITPLHRVYDRSQLDELLAPLRVRQVAFGVRDGDSWVLTADEATAARADSAERVTAVALVVAEKP